MASEVVNISISSSPHQTPIVWQDSVHQSNLGEKVLGYCSRGWQSVNRDLEPRLYIGIWRGYKKTRAHRGSNTLKNPRKSCSSTCSSTIGLSSLNPSGPELSAGNLNIVSKGVPGTSKPCLGTLNMTLPTYKEDESVRDLKVGMDQEE